MNRIDCRLPALVLASLYLPMTAAAQDADELPPELLACADETDVARRLECFDREMAKLRATPEPDAPSAAVAEPEPAVADAAPEPAADVPAPEPAMETAAAAPEVAPAAARTVSPGPAAAATAAASAASTAESTTTERAATPAASADPEKDFGLPDDRPDAISARVSNIMKRPYGELVILLDNGQIWEQKHRDSRFRLEIGENVTISEGLISGYRLTGGGRNNSIQVERLK